MTGSPPSKTEFHGYYPGVVGKIIEAHAIYYHEYWGFDATFETQVARELADFVGAFQKTRDGLWAATVRGRFAGSVAIDGRLAHREGARLRWFLVVPDFQGGGIGKALITRAVEFCRDRRYVRVYLWTFRGLEVARCLYEGAGFRLSEEHGVTQWGQLLTEQRYELRIYD